MSSLAWAYVLIDVPAESTEVARRFWSQVTGWSIGEAGADQLDFVTLVPPEGTSYVHVQTGGGSPRVCVTDQPAAL